MIIYYDKTRNTTKTYHNSVGIHFITVGNRTKEAGIDGTNSHYIAPNGNDTTGTGTSGNPWLTLDKAIENQDSTYKNILIIRNGYTGVMRFEAPIHHIPLDCVIQTDDVSEYAVIYMEQLETEEATTSITDDFNGIGYGNGNVFACRATTGTKLQVSTDYGKTWAELATSPTPTGILRDIIYNNGTWILLTSQNGIYYSNNDGATWNASTAPTSINWQMCAYGNGIWIAGGTAGTSQTLYKSEDDGVTWSSITGTEYQYLYAMAFGNNRWLVNREGEGRIYYSDDNGATWTGSNSPYDSYQEIKYANGLWVAVGFLSGPLYSINGIDWFYADYIENYDVPGGSTEERYRGLTYGNGVWICSCLYNWYWSVDAKKWHLIITPDYSGTSAGSNWIDIDFAELHIVGISAINSSKINYITGAVLNANNDLILNGLKIDGQEKALHGIITGDPDTSTDLKVSWCDVANFILDVFPYDHPQTYTLNNSIFHDCRYIVYELTDGPTHDIDYNIFYNAENTAIRSLSADFISNWTFCTFYNCGIGAEILVSQTPTDKSIKHHIFAKCGIDIKSDIDLIVPKYSIIETGCIGCDISDSTLLYKVETLFRDVLNADFELRHHEDGYPYESPGIEYSENWNYDIGAWDIRFSLISAVWKQLSVPYNDIQVRRPQAIEGAQTNVSYGGGYSREHITDLVVYDINVINSNTKITDQFKNILRQKKAFPVFPAKNRIYQFTSNPTFTWKDKTSIDGKIEMIISDTDRATLLTLLDTDRPEGMFILVWAISGSSTPWNVAYPFKIVGYQHNTLLLENYMGNYPGTGFASNPDGNYFSIYSELLWIGNLLFKGAQSDGTYRFYGDNLYQKWTVNQWKGYWMAVLTTLGSRNYVPIAYNDEENIYFWDVHNGWGAISIDTYKNMIIDVIMMKSEPNMLDSSPLKLEGSQFARQGNDIYHTAALDTIENQAFYAYEESNFTIRLIQSLGLKKYRDWDEEGI